MNSTSKSNGNSDRSTADTGGKNFKPGQNRNKNGGTSARKLCSKTNNGKELLIWLWHSHCAHGIKHCIKDCWDCPEFEGKLLLEKPGHNCKTAKTCTSKQNSGRILGLPSYARVRSYRRFLNYFRRRPSGWSFFATHRISYWCIPREVLSSQLLGWAEGFLEEHDLLTGTSCFSRCWIKTKKASTTFIEPSPRKKKPGLWRTCGLADLRTCGSADMRTCGLVDCELLRDSSSFSLGSARKQANKTRWLLVLRKFRLFLQLLVAVTKFCLSRLPVLSRAWYRVHFI